MVWPTVTEINVWGFLSLPDTHKFILYFQKQLLALGDLLNGPLLLHATEKTYLGWFKEDEILITSICKFLPDEVLATKGKKF